MLCSIPQFSTFNRDWFSACVLHTDDNRNRTDTKADSNPPGDIVMSGFTPSVQQTQIRLNLHLSFDHPGPILQGAFRFVLLLQNFAYKCDPK